MTYDPTTHYAQIVHAFDGKMSVSSTATTITHNCFGPAHRLYSGVAGPFHIWSTDR